MEAHILTQRLIQKETQMQKYKKLKRLSTHKCVQIMMPRFK